MNLHHVALTVKNLSESKDFYEKFFGFKQKKFFEKPDEKAKAVFLECGNTQIELWEFIDPLPYQKENLNRIGIRHLAFEVENLDDFVKKLPEDLVQKPAKIGASGGKYCFLKDPSGIDIELYEPN